MCHTVYTQAHTTQNFINQQSKLTCNSEVTDGLPGTQLPKDVGVAKRNNKPIKIDAFFGYS
jgi:hypothetical protein